MYTELCVVLCLADEEVYQELQSTKLHKTDETDH